MSAVTHLNQVGFPALLDTLRASFPGAIAIDYPAVCGFSADKLLTDDQAMAINRLGMALGMLIDLKLARGHFYESQDATYYWDYHLTPAGYRALSMRAVVTEATLQGVLAALAETVPERA
ncbi:MULTISPECIES: hypothetical protein [Novosphingobium]|uniref:hypothetical protein n=1 Tax=Novosphingobium TaxID=165696 RepID=UPI000787A30F|nr:MULTISPECIES: hypothetical protein [Novosphingobium]PTR10401.1 hypothetical protein C8K11_107106 [Novosphingobium sp. GV055]PUB03072.1 hypothetical protein C8K12_107106 [Novosphingobium sp. GV061]PUB19733.1 hypothetical protein C8K14_107106 [Novosphingobium sp. GV079]PUB41372.1 hypothetical protein C8K10_107106 [Novosphingobium sp. GV027]WQD94150.1 hypothetical protein U0041_06075 [Novosphingobium capsulatum]